MGLVLSECTLWLRILGQVFVQYMLCVMMGFACSELLGVGYVEILILHVSVCVVCLL